MHCIVFINVLAPLLPSILLIFGTWCLWSFGSASVSVVSDGIFWLYPLKRLYWCPFGIVNKMWNNKHSVPLWQACSKQLFAETLLNASWNGENCQRSTNQVYERSKQNCVKKKVEGRQNDSNKMQSDILYCTLKQLPGRNGLSLSYFLHPNVNHLITLKFYPSILFFFLWENYPKH